MAWLDDALPELIKSDAWGYHRGQPTATEPAAFVALALVSYSLHEEARRPLQWLLDHQSADGRLGVTAEQDSPNWPTSLAIIAWLKASEHDDRGRYSDAIERAVVSLLRIKGKPFDRQVDMGHDTTLIGWPWVEGTHSWLEPTAFAVLALKAAGQNDAPRTREAVRLIIDRFLPEGGCNYGNTFVLGQLLRPHVQPSGVALAAVVDERDPSGRLERTVGYVRQAISSDTTCTSLCFALLGLGAANALPDAANRWLESAAQRTLKREASPYKLALLALAAKSSDKPLRAAGHVQPTL
jgi:hypothetical protein